MMFNSHDNSRHEFCLVETLEIEFFSTARKGIGGTF